MHAVTQEMTRSHDATSCSSTSLPSALRDHSALLLRLVLCLFLINCKPSEPFLALYLTRDKGLSEATLDVDVWPYDTYGAFAFLLPLGAAAEVLGYRSVILLGLLCREATRALLLFGEGTVATMAMMQLFYAAATGATTVYFAYILTAVPPELRAAATSCAFVAFHAGNVCGSMLGSVLMPLVELRTLFFISWGFTTAGALAFLLLPAPLYVPPPSLAALLCRDGPRAVGAELCELYGADLQRLWLLWWCTGYAAWNIVANYYQTQLLGLADGADDEQAFGYIEAGLEAAMVIGSACAALMPAPTFRADAAHLCVGALGVAGCLGATLLRSPPPTLASTAALNATALGALGFQQARGTVAVATAIGGRRRYSVVLTVNAFLALGGAMLAQQVASAFGAGTAAHYWMAIGAMLLLCLVSGGLFLCDSAFGAATPNLLQPDPDASAADQPTAGPAASDVQCSLR